MPDASLMSELACPAERRGWVVESSVRGVAGSLVIVGTALAAFVDTRWLLLDAFVGANLLQSSISGWCLLSNLLAIARSRRGGDR